MAVPILACNFDSGTATSVPCSIGGPVTKDATVTLITDGTHNCMRVPNETYPTGMAYFPVSLATALTGFSISLWLRTTVALVNGQGFAILMDLSGDWNFTIQQVNATQRFVAGSSVTNLATATPVTGNSNVWHHYAMSLDRSNARFYVDGVLVGTAAVTGWYANPSTSLTTLIDFGAVGTLYDDVRIYNTAILQADVTTDFTTPVSAAAPTVPANSSVSDARRIKLNGPANPFLTNMDLLNASLAGDVQKYGYGYAVIKNWGTLGVDSVTSARRKHAGATAFESVHDAELRYYKS